MGNAGSSRDRHKSGDNALPSSPNKEGQVFLFDKKNSKLILQSSNEDDEPYYTKTPSKEDGDPRPRASTVSEGIKPGARVLPTVFKWDGGGTDVKISGTFTKWEALPMAKSHGDFVTIVDLPEGEHHYKFYVDGEWKHDPTVATVNNELGTRNNVVNVQKSDFEVFEALAMDSGVGQQSTEFSQEIPINRSWEKVSGPPILPPHLLQVILNKDTPLSCEPTLLPEPNHVMLNHLYALSIKDGVMVLSATHRFRKKYVTTLLYKPIST